MQVQDGALEGHGKVPEMFVGYVDCQEFENRGDSSSLVVLSYT